MVRSEVSTRKELRQMHSPLRRLALSWVIVGPSHARTRLEGRVTNLRSAWRDISPCHRAEGPRKGKNGLVISLAAGYKRRVRTLHATRTRRLAVLFALTLTMASHLVRASCSDVPQGVSPNSGSRRTSSVLSRIGSIARSTTKYVRRLFCPSCASCSHTVLSRRLAHAATATVVRASTSSLPFHRRSSYPTSTITPRTTQYATRPRRSCRRALTRCTRTFTVSWRSLGTSWSSM